MSKDGLQARFIVPVSIFVFVLILGGAMVFSGAESSRIQGEVAAEVDQQIDSVLKILGVTDVLVMQQVEGSMWLLIERGTALGAVTPGAPVQVKEKTVPNFSRRAPLAGFVFLSGTLGPQRIWLSMLANRLS